MSFVTTQKSWRPKAYSNNLKIFETENTNPNKEKIICDLKLKSV